MSTLILGRSNYPYYSKKIEKAIDLNDVKEKYGKDSRIYEAYEEAQLLNLKDIYILSFYSDNDFIDMIYEEPSYIFDYVIPVGINLSETIVYEGEKKISLSALLIKYFYEYCDLIIFSIEHASFFENIEEYISAINSEMYKFQGNKFISENESKIVSFVSNNLKEYMFANVVLASMLESCDLKKYPKKDLGEVIFDLQHDDFNLVNNVIYFSYNDLCKTSVENLVTFNFKMESEKYIIPYLIKKYIEKNIDIKQFTGRMYNLAVKLQIFKHIERVLLSNLGTLLSHYKINRFSVFKNLDATVSIDVDFDIVPYSSIEKINMKIGSEQ